MLLVIIASLLVYASFYLINKTPPLIAYFLPFYFGVLNFLFILFVQNSLNQAISKFTSKYLAGTAIRFVLGLIFVIIFVLLNKENAIAFVIVFSINYLIFLVHEIIEMLQFSKKTKPRVDLRQ